MVIRLDGARDDGAARLRRIAEEAGWRWLPRGGDLVRLEPVDSDAACDAGWITVEVAGEQTVATVWLPDEGAPMARERLETALEQVACPGGECGEPGLMRRLRRIEGQVRGLQRMIDDGRDCEAVLTQWSAVNMALKQAAAHLVADHLVDCVRTEIADGGDPSAINRRLMNVLF